MNMLSNVPCYLLLAACWRQVAPVAGLEILRLRPRENTLAC